MANQKTLNHECRNCGKKYYACNDCERINSWKTICCSVECYDAYTEKVIRSRMKKAPKVTKAEPVESEVAPVVEVTEVKVEQSEVVTPNPQIDNNRKKN